LHDHASDERRGIAAFPSATSCSASGRVSKSMSLVRWLTAPARSARKRSPSSSETVSITIFVVGRRAAISQAAATPRPACGRRAGRCRVVSRAPAAPRGARRPPPRTRTGLPRSVPGRHRRASARGRQRPVPGAARLLLCDVRLARDRRLAVERHRSDVLSTRLGLISVTTLVV
jgi:hypothetical protein